MPGGGGAGGKLGVHDPETEPALQQRRPVGAALVLSQQQSLVLPQHLGEYVQKAQWGVARHSSQHSCGSASCPSNRKCATNGHEYARLKPAARE